MGINFTHVLWHTSSDLMFRRGAADYVKKFDIGLSKKTWVAHLKINEDLEGPHMVQYQSEMVSRDYWFQNIALDPLIVPFLKDTQSDALHKARFEGAFFAKDIFFDLMEPVLRNRTLEEMAPRVAPYPLEEFLFVQCAVIYKDKHPYLQQAPSLVYTAPSNSGLLTVDDLKDLAKTEGIFGAKRFTSDLNSPERHYVRESLGII